jgi:hypothetical protein
MKNTFEKTAVFEIVNVKYDDAIEIFKAPARKHYRE